MRLALCLFLFGIPFLAFPQNNSLQIKGKVVDALSGEALPYVNIVLTNSNRGTISNSQGVFTIENLKSGDSLEFSFIGYKNFDLIIRGSRDSLILKMKPENKLLNSVTIYGNDEFLNEMIQKVRKRENKSHIQAKTYYSLSSQYKNEEVELLEAYYNGEFRGADVVNLHIKNGRIALKNKDDRFFISSETSLAFCRSYSFDENQYFPSNPLEMSKKKLSENYNLALEERYISSKGRVIYIISCHPKKNKASTFESTFWVDSASSSLLRLKFEITDAKVHPFVSLSSRSKLEKIDLSIRKNFIEIEGQSFLKTMDFDYRLHYVSERGNPFTLKSEAVLYAYAFKEAFNLPFFEFSKGSYEDYRNINASPYHSEFWKLNTEFTLYDGKEKEELFKENSAGLSNRELFIGNKYFKTGFFEHPYVFWSEKRIAFRPEEGNQKIKVDPLPSNRYHFEVQIYLDYSIFEDSIYYNIATIFDPFKTFCYLPESPQTEAFINIYFDLMEIEKRKMEKELRVPGIEEKDIEIIYNNCKRRCEKISRQYFKEVQRAKNWLALEQWNARVKKELGIDNILIYQLKDPSEFKN